MNKDLSQNTDNVNHKESALTKDVMDIFQQPQMADEWKQRTIHFFGAWVHNKKNLSYWDFVRFYGFRKGILKKLGREVFAHYLVTECRQALNASDTESSLISSMCKFKYKKSFKKHSKDKRKKQCPNVEWKFDLLPEAHACKSLERELDELWNKELPNLLGGAEPTMEERLQEHIIVLEKETPRSKAYTNPQYKEEIFNFSIEVYANDEFKRKRLPTHIIAFQCIDKPVDDNDIYKYSAEFKEKREIKIYLCSTFPYSLNLKRKAIEFDIGLILVNPKNQITRESYVTPRSIEAQGVEQIKLEELIGKRDMTSTFVICDNYGITFSLADILTNNGIKVNPSLSFTAPFFSNDYIESQANEIVKDKIEVFIRDIKSYQYTGLIPSFDANPKQLLIDNGYSLETKVMPDSTHLAGIDFKNKKVTLDSTLCSDMRRVNYTLGHELGHHVLHSEILNYDFSETNSTLDLSAFSFSREQKWIEHHADHYAACLLMPTIVVGCLYTIYYWSLYGIGNVFPFCLDHQYFKLHDYNCIVRPMAEKMNVSMEALKWRLVNLKLLDIRL